MTLRIASNLALPDDFVTQPAAILARRGAGKTYTAMVLTEELVANRLPVVVLDPLGVTWGLRSSADGTKPGLPVTIMGGAHGDVPLEPTGGKVAANFVVDHPAAYVLDLSGFESNAQQDRFACDFAETLYRAKNRDREALHLVVDEADSFAPQRPQKGQERMLGAFEAIVRRGRARGLGVTLISQRPAVLNKNVLSQIECLIALQVTAPQDRAALDEWAKGWSTPTERTEFLAALATLKIGEGWIWSPTWLEIFQPIKIRARRTFDSSATPKAGETRVEPRRMADVDLDVLKEQMAETIEKADATDPKKLAARIRELEGEIADMKVHTPEPIVETVEVERLVPVIPEEARALVGEFMESVRLSILDAAAELKTKFEAVAPPAALENPVSASTTRRPPAGTPAPARAPRDISPKTLPGDVTLGKGERKVLAVLAQYPDGRTYNELAFLAGYSAKASTLGVILSTLRKAELVEPGNQPVRPTQAGLDAVGGAQQPPAGPELLNHWLNHPRVGTGERTVLQALIDAYPDALTHAELCDATGYSPDASTIGVILSKLRKLGIVEKARRRVPDEFMEAIR